MNDLMDVTMNTSRLTPIEIALGIDENGMTTAKKLYEFLELNPGNYARWCKSNISDNPFAEEGKDYYSSCVKSEGKGNFADDFKLTATFAKKLSMTQKNQKGEDARDYFTKVEDGAKEMVLRMQEISPQLQVMINIELEQKRQREEQKRQAERLEQLDDRIDSIKEVVSLRPNAWRKDTANLINRMALKAGGYEHIKLIRDESYRILEERMHVALNIRLTNKRKTLALNNTCKSKLDKLNILDVIADDPKLIEGYISVVKDMAIKYGVA